ncbi:hypothetical protein ACMVI2_004250 [Salmonella enterica]
MNKAYRIVWNDRNKIPDSTRLTSTPAGVLPYLPVMILASAGLVISGEGKAESFSSRDDTESISFQENIKKQVLLTGTLTSLPPYAPSR